METVQSSKKDYQRSIAICQSVLRLLTIVILSAFVLIIAMTTVSTGGFVQMVAKGLYYLIVLSALVSLGIWICRLRMERGAAGSGMAGMAQRGKAD